MNKHEDLSLEDLQIMAAIKEIMAAIKAHQQQAEATIYKNAERASDIAFKYGEAVSREIAQVMKSDKLEDAQKLIDGIYTQIGGEVTWWEVQLITKFIAAMLKSSQQSSQPKDGDPEHIIMLAVASKFIHEFQNLNKNVTMETDRDDSK